MGVVPQYFEKTYVSVCTIVIGMAIRNFSCQSGSNSGISQGGLDPQVSRRGIVRSRFF